MEYIFEKTLKYNAEDFFKCYNETKDILDNNFDFEEATGLNEDQKRAFFKAKYMKYIKAGPPAFCWKISDESGTLMVNTGILNGSRLEWYLGLTARNANNSKSWLYDPDYNAAELAFWAEHGITSLSAIFANEDSNNSARNYGKVRGSSPVEGDNREYSVDGIYVNLEVPSS
jgi:hypothetical protein